MKKERYSGVLLHPTSLPGPYGIGDLGKAAYQFAEMLSAASATLWQILPLGPTGYGNSPYSARSTYAGNTLLISPEILFEQGHLSREQLEEKPDFPEERINYGAVEEWKQPLLITATKHFIAHASADEKLQFAKFEKENGFWLDDYALFAVATEVYGDSRWFSQWDRKLRFRDPETLAKWRTQYSHEVEIQKILQFFFSSQWMNLKGYVNSLGIKLIGDIPIFVAADSADAWVNLDLFKTDAEGDFSAQSGVPPDFFSETGQLWGTPVYNWEEKEHALLDWWMQRIRFSLNTTDIIRIDHFRGLEAYWEVPAGEKTAMNGVWKQASGRKLFERIGRDLGVIPIIAEDLGVMTPEVEQLRDDFNLPGMKILQFAFDLTGPGRLNPSHDFLPHNYGENCVAYTGTHDNDTTVGWYESLSEAHRDIVRRYLARSGDDIAWSMMRQVMSSVARYALFPLQDLLSLDGESRMNKPSTVGDANWSWRLTQDKSLEEPAARFREMVHLYGRAPEA